MKSPFPHFTPPFHYDDFGGQIADSRGTRMLDIRGWGYLTGTGHMALGLSEGEATKAQDQIAKSTVAALNKYAEEHPTLP